MTMATGAGGREPSRAADIPKHPKLIDATESAYAYPLLIKSLLHSAIRHSPKQEIVYRDRMRYDYGIFASRIARLANGLAALGVGPGDTVAVMDWDSHRYLECYFAVPGMGAILHTVNVRLSPDQILYTINHAEDDVILVHADFLPLIEELWPRIERPCKLILLCDDAIPVSGVPIEVHYETMLEAAVPEFDFPDLDERTCATTFYTTGTTGLPKGVFFSHRQIVLHTLAVAATFGGAVSQGRFHRGDVYMPITPMFHVHAWGMPFVATMLGVKQVYPGRYAPETLLDLLKGEGVTFSHCVPTILHMLLDHSAARNFDFRGWKVVVGGSALPTELARNALERGIDLFTGYGMSETCPILTLAQMPAELPDDSLERQIELRTLAGRSLPLVDLQIVDPSVEDVGAEAGISGEIVVRAPWLTQGYRGDEANSEILWRGGYLHTGDVGSIDGQGFLRISDRMKDVIKTGGEWISSLQIEDLILTHPCVSEVAVIAVPDGRWGERPLALVVPRSDRELVDDAAIKSHLQTFSDRGLISKWAVPARVVIVDALAKTSVGKLDKKLLRQRIQSNEYPGS